jgi:hypothetical protein
MAGDLVEPRGKVVNEHDRAVASDKGGGLDFKVLDFTYSYAAWSDQLHVTGRAVNHTGEPQQGVRIQIDAYDQFGKHLGYNESYLSPAYVKPGGEGRFDLYLNHGHWVEALVLEYRFAVRE